MKKIQYDGFADFKEFSAVDFERVEVEAADVVFQRGVPLEVDDKVAEVLLAGTGVFEGEPFSESIDLERDHTDVDEEPDDF